MERKFKMPLAYSSHRQILDGNGDLTIEVFSGGMGVEAADEFQEFIVTACNLHDALLEYFKAATGYNNTVGHEDATVEDERKAEARFDAATQAAHKALTAAGAK